MQMIDTVNIYSSSTTAPTKYSVGQLYQDFKGNVYAYAKAGGTALDKAKVVQTAVPDANVVNVTVAEAASIGDTEVTIDSGGAIVANTYSGGTLHINDADGEGDAYEVLSHGALSSAGELILYIKEALRTALVKDTSEASLNANQYSGIVIAATTGKNVGIPPVAISANEYGFILVDGVAPVLVSGTPAIGKAIISANGAAAISAAVTDDKIGNMLETGVSTEYKLAKFKF